MQISVENTSDLGRCVTVELPGEGLARKINDRLGALRDQVTVDGFRPGKVPLDVVRSKYGDQVKEEVFSEVINDSLQQALGQEQLEPVGEPVVSVDDSSMDALLRFSATFEVMPEIEVQPVERIKMTKPVVDITDQDVDNLIANLRSQRVTWKEVDRPASPGDRVTVDYEGTVSGQSFPGSVAKELPVVIGEGSLIPGFEEQMAGLVKGETADITVTIPDSFSSPVFRGQNAVFKVRLIRVEEAQLPELDERFFNSFGVREGGLSGFREKVRHSMEIELRQKMMGTMKEELLSQLLELHAVQVPETLLGLEVDRMKQVAADGAEGAGATEDLVEQARYRVSCGIILTELAKKLEISGTSDQIRAKVESLAESYENPDEVVAWYYSSPEQMASVEAMVNEELILDYVLEHGKVTERVISFSEMMNS